MDSQYLQETQLDRDKDLTHLETFEMYLDGRSYENMNINRLTIGQL